MSAGDVKYLTKIPHVVRLRQMLRRWRNKARSSRCSAPADVPAGHVAVCVGAASRRFVLPAVHLNHPVFRDLLVRAEEEYGFGNSGPLAIPCDESVFQDVAGFLCLPPDLQELTLHHCHMSVRDCGPETYPLLHGFSSGRSVW